MNENSEQYQIRFPKTQAWLRQNIPSLYRLIGRLYLQFLSIDKYKLQAALRHQVNRQRKMKKSRMIFVQVGSNDGLTNDPIRHFILEAPSIAILVEPVPSCFARLNKNYSATDEYNSSEFDIRLRQLAVGPVSGTSKFFSISSKAVLELGEQLPEWWDQIGSFNKDHITRHLNGALTPYIDEIEINAIRLGELLISEHIENVDVLHIDAEGYDLEVLKSLDLSDVKVSCILIEWKHLSDADQIELNHLLAQTGYKVRKFKSDIIATLV